MNTSLVQTTVAFALVLILSACPDKTIPPTPAPPPPSPAVIPTTTKVADPATRTALNAFDAKAGTMRFSQGTPVVQTLKPGDVLVGEPSSAAPYGYLRKIKTIRNENAQTVLETTQANLTDAISKGALDAKGTLKPSQVHTARALRSGVKPQFGDGFDYEVAVHTVYTPDPPGKGEVHIDGYVRFNLGYHVGLDISGCFEIPPVCLDKFEASAGFDQQSDLKITGNLETPIKKDIDLAEYSFDPIVFFIGPVPVVIVPKVTVSVGVDGQASVQFSYSANEKARLEVGARWTDGNGWEDISGKDFFYSIGQPQVQGSVKVKGAVSMEGQLLLYDVAGPGLNTQLGLSFDAQVPRNPFWTLSAFISEDITFVVDLPVIGKIADYSANLLEWSMELARSRNTSPTITIMTDPVKLELANAVDLLPSDYSSIYKVSDFEDGRVTNVQVVSDRDGPITTRTYKFPNEGSRVITVTATDSQGASSSAKFTVNVFNTPPIVSLATSGNLPVYRGVPTQLSGHAEEKNPSTGQFTIPVPCDHMSWTSSVTSDVMPSSCSGNATFQSNGQRTLTLMATGTNGARGTASVSITVTDPPANLPPVLDEMHIKDSLGNEINDSQRVLTFKPLSLSVKAHDPENDAITYSWSACLKGWTALQCSQNGNLPTNPDGSSSFDPMQRGYGIYTFFVTADDGRHTFASISSRIIDVEQPIN